MGLACETYLVILAARACSASLSFAMCKSLCVILGASPFPRSQREALSHITLSRIFPSVRPADVLCP
jgi:hypothetical protein